MSNKIPNWIIGVCAMAIIALICISYNNIIDDLKYNLEIKEHNEVAMIDSLKIYKTTCGEQAIKMSYLVKDNDELMCKLNMSKNEVMTLKNRVRDLNTKLKSIAKTETLIKVDSIFIKPSDIPNTYVYKDKYIDMSITATPPEWMVLNNLSMRASLTVGTTEDHKFIVQTDNPYIHFTDIQSAEVYKKKKKVEFTHGFYLGVGATYGLINNKVDFGPQFGYGISVKF